MTNPTIQIGETQYEVKRFVLGEVIEVVPMIMKASETLSKGQIDKPLLDAMVDVVAFAARRVDANFTRDMLTSQEMSLVELRTAFGIIASQVGMTASKGEAAAA